MPIDHPLPGKTPGKDDYAHVAESGWVNGSMILSSEFDTMAASTDRPGIVPWHINTTGDSGIAQTVSLLDLGVNDPRYRECEAFARELREKYPLAGLDPNKPEDRAVIEQREQAITNQMVGKMHQVYGDFNQNGVAEVAGIPQDELRAHLAGGTPALVSPPSVGSMHNGELVCRHYAPLADRFLSDAGMSLYRESGLVMRYDVSPDGQITERGGGGHMWLASRLTSNVVETTIDGGAPCYFHSLSHATAESIAERHTNVAQSPGGQVLAYSVGEGARHDTEITSASFWQNGKLYLTPDMRADAERAVRACVPPSSVQNVTTGPAPSDSSTQIPKRASDDAKAAADPLIRMGVTFEDATDILPPPKDSRQVPGPGRAR